VVWCFVFSAKSHDLWNDTRDEREVREKVSRYTPTRIISGLPGKDAAKAIAIVHDAFSSQLHAFNYIIILALCVHYPLISRIRREFSFSEESLPKTLV